MLLSLWFITNTCISITSWENCACWKVKYWLLLAFPVTEKEFDKLLCQNNFITTKLTIGIFCIFINLYFYLLTFLHIHQKNPSLMFIKFIFHTVSYAHLTLFLIYIILHSSTNRPLRILPCIHIWYFGIFNEIKLHSTLHFISHDNLSLWKSKWS